MLPKRPTWCGQGGAKGFAWVISITMGMKISWLPTSDRMSLYRNEGNGSFADITEKAGLLHKNPRWSTGCTFIDYDKDGKLDLFVAEYVIFDIKKVPAKGTNQYCQWKGIPVMCGPRGLPGGTNMLYRQ